MDTTRTPRRSPRRVRARRGGAAIEFALVLFPLLILVFGIIEYGWVFFQQANVLSAAREGARLGVTVDQAASPTPGSTAETRARAVLTQYGMDGAGAAIVTTQSGTSPQETLTVDVTVPYTPLVGFIGVATPSSLHAEMTMLLELQD